MRQQTRKPGLPTGRPQDVVEAMGPDLEADVGSHHEGSMSGLGGRVFEQLEGRLEDQILRKLWGRFTVCQRGLLYIRLSYKLWNTMETWP